MTEHPELADLCAAFAISSPAQDEPVREHVDSCPACREKVEAFLRDADLMMAELAPDAGDGLDVVTDRWNWNQGDAERRLMERTFAPTPVAGNVDRELSIEFRDGKPAIAAPVHAGNRSIGIWSGLKPSYAVAAGLLIAIGAGMAGFWLRGKSIDKAPAPLQVVATHIDSDAHALLNERDALRRQLEERELFTTTLSDRVKKQGVEIERLRQEIQTLEAASSDGDRSRQNLESDKQALNAKLQTAQGTLDTMQQTLLQETQVNERLRTLVQERDATLQRKDQELRQDKELLASDRDVRDLVTARDLLVAEVYDLDKNGGYRKPYARVFFTKDKSLIFYGYDLDQQQGVREASVFQAWGNRGPNRKDALNLGFLYQDSAQNRRWMLKLNDPQTIQQIDAVFITLEPKGGSSKPTGKAILFASLRLPPNHP